MHASLCLFLLLRVKYHLDQKVLGLVTVWRSRSADFNSFFVVLVEVSLTFCQIFSLISNDIERFPLAPTIQKWSSVGRG